MAIQLDMEMTFVYQNDQLHYDDKLDFLGLPATVINAVTLPNVYVMVDRISGDKSQIDFTLNYFKDSSKEHLIKTSHHTFTPSVDDNAVNFVKQIYEYIKTAPVFVDAIDV